MKHSAGRVALCMWVVAGCTSSPPATTSFERAIQPILTNSCAGNTAGCHSRSAGDPLSQAAGNLDVTSYAAIAQRPDLLTPYSPTPYPLLLIEAVPAGSLTYQDGGAVKSIDIRHAGGGIIAVDSDAFDALQTWLDNGALQD